MPIRIKLAFLLKVAKRSHGHWHPFATQSGHSVASRTGVTRAQRLTPESRHEIAALAAKARCRDSSPQCSPFSPSELSLDFHSILMSPVAMTVALQR